MRGTIPTSAGKLSSTPVVLLLLLSAILGSASPLSAALIVWGANDQGQVGNGLHGYNEPWPVAVEALECTSIIDADASSLSSVAMTSARADNTYTWGSNAFRELGPPELTDPFMTVPRLTTLASGVSVAAGGYHMLATSIVDGAVKLQAWGNSNYGQAGVMGVWSVAVPIEITLPGTPPPTPTAAYGGDIFSMALGSDKQVYTWGNNLWCQLARLPRGSHSEVPGAVLTSSSAPLTDVDLASAGAGFAVAIDENHAIWTWGQNTKCQLGTTAVLIGKWRCSADAGGIGLPTFDQDIYPVSVSAGAEHVMVLLNDGRVFAWGNNSHGELGQGTTSSYSCAAVQVAGVPKIAKVAAGGYHNLALDQDGKIWAWGWNGSGQLGDGSLIDRYSPVDISASGALNVLRISNVRAGFAHSMAW